MSATPLICPFCSSPHFTFTGSIDLPQFQCWNCNSHYGFPDNREPRQRILWRFASLFGNIIGNIVIVCFVISLLILAYSYGTVLNTGSMEPTLSGNDVVWMNPLANNFQRGDLITFPDPRKQGESLIKRIVGLPGETVEVSIGNLYIDGKLFPEPWLADFAKSTVSADKTTLGTREYYVLGDNRRYSLDSTELGPIHHDHIISKVFLHLDISPIDLNFGSRLRTMNRSSANPDARDRVLEVNRKVRR